MIHDIPHPNHLFHLVSEPYNICISWKTKLKLCLSTSHLPISSLSSMGFPSVCYCVLLPGPLVVLLQILDQIRLFLVSVFHFLGLYTPSDVPVTPFDDNVYRLSPADLPYLPVSPASIKRRLPVVQFSTFRRRLPAAVIVDRELACAVCLCVLEGRHEVRVLGNCNHTFHKGCIDKWVDLGQVTCPLCRSRLLPRGAPRWWNPLLPSLDRTW